MDTEDARLAVYRSFADTLPDEPDVLVATRCPGCDAALAWVVGREVPPAGDEVAHFLIPVARMWDDVVHTCGNQRLFCSDVERWRPLIFLVRPIHR